MSSATLAGNGRRIYAVAGGNPNPKRLSKFVDVRRWRRASMDGIRLPMCCRMAAHRFAAWRSGGFLAQKFNRRTALEPTTKLSYEALNPPLRQTAVRCWRSCPMSFVIFIFRFSFCCRPCTTFGNFPHLSVRLNAKVLCGRLPFRLVQIFHRTLHKLLFVFRMLLVSDCQ